MRERCVIFSDEYYEEVHRTLQLAQPIKNVRYVQLEDRWEVHFTVPDSTMVDIINRWSLKLNWNPLQIGLYYL